MAMTSKGRIGGRGGAVVVKVLVGLLIVGVGAVGVYASRGGRGGESAPGRSAADLVTVATMSFDITTTATGELQAKNQIELRNELESEATISELKPEGAFVQKGDVVVRLNVDQVQGQLDEAELRVASAKSDLVAAEKGLEIQQSDNLSKIRQAKLKLDLAQLALDQWEKGLKVQKLKDIALGLDKTEKDLARLEEKYVQSQNLFKEGFVSKDEMQQDEIALREARAARDKAVLEDQTYNSYEMPKDERQKRSDVEEAKAELDRTQQQAEIQLAIKDAEKFNKQRQLSLQEEKLAKLKRQVAAATVTAPQDGLVVYASSAGRSWRDDSPFVVGRKVYPQETLIVLPDTGDMVAAVRVHETLAGRIHAGQAATVKIDSYPGRVFSGEVDSIGVMAESQGRWMDPNRREYTIKIAIDRPGDDVSFKPAMRCEATVMLGRVEDVQAVPLQAVFADEAVRFVYTPRGAKFERVPVRVGRRSDTMAELTAGAEPGQRVLVREPTPGEILRTPWDAAKLKLVGMQLDPEGKPVPEGKGGEGKLGPGGGPGRGARGGEAGPDGRPGRRGPGGRGGRSEAAAPKADPSAEAKPAAEAKTDERP